MKTFEARIELTVWLDKPDCRVDLRSTKVDGLWTTVANCKPGPIWMGPAEPSLSKSVGGMCDRAKSRGAHPAFTEDRQWFIDHVTDRFSMEEHG